MTDEMLALARANAADAGVANVEFVKGYIEELPLWRWSAGPRPGSASTNRIVIPRPSCSSPTSSRAMLLSGS
jgi:hypothetical protein